MFLADSAILAEMEAGNIKIEGFDLKHLNPCSVDLTLGANVRVYTKETIKCHITKAPDWVLRSGHCIFHSDDVIEYEVPLDCKKDNPSIELIMPEDGFVLIPGEVYLYATNEQIAVKGNLCAEIIGKSSNGRLGLDIHICAGHIDPGFEGSLVLELRVEKPLRIYPNMPICKIKYIRVDGNILEPYGSKKKSKYYKQVGTQPSKMHLNFENNEKES